jgi:hypothetical protein
VQRIPNGSRELREGNDRGNGVVDGFLFGWVGETSVGYVAVGELFVVESGRD